MASFDPAKLTDTIYKYTDCQIQSFEFKCVAKGDQRVVALCIEPSEVPIVFSQTGNYLDSMGKQRNAFLGGTVYFRHNAKSEPGNTEDLRLFVDRRLKTIRKEWLEKIATVVEAPLGSAIQVIRPGESISATPARLVAVPGAAPLPVGAIDEGWPYRQKEVVIEVNSRLAGLKTVNPNHILHVRRAHEIEKQGEYCYTQKHMSPKYSEAFVRWIVEQFNANPEFFETSKQLADQKTKELPLIDAKTSTR